MWRWNWLYWTIHKSGNVPSSKERDAPSGSMKWKGFIGRRSHRERKERIISGWVLFFGEGRGLGRDQQGFLVQITSVGLIGEFQIDCLKIAFLEEVKVTIKSWSDVVRTNDSILGLLFLFFFLTGHTGWQGWESWECLGRLGQHPWCIKGETGTPAGREWHVTL